MKRILYSNGLFHFPVQMFYKEANVQVALYNANKRHPSNFSEFTKRNSKSNTKQY